MTDPIITTFPSQIIAGSPSIITYKNINILPISGYTYILKNQIGIIVSDKFIVPKNSSLTTFLFNNVFLYGGINTLTIYNKITGCDIGATFAINIEGKIVPPKEIKNNTQINKLNNNAYIKKTKLFKYKLINKNTNLINKNLFLRKMNMYYK